MSTPGHAVKDSGYLLELKETVLKFLEGEDVKVVLFGSRARGDSLNTSDVDIGIMPGAGFDRKKLVLLREHIEEMNIPYKVEVVELSGASSEFRAAALREAEVWKG